MAVTTSTQQAQDIACPVCKQPISRAAYVQIENRIRHEEQQRNAAIEAERLVERAAWEAKVKADQSTLQLRYNEASEKLEKLSEAAADSERRLKEAVTAAALAERTKVEAEQLKKQQAEREGDRALLEAAFNQRMVKAQVDSQETNKALQKEVAELQKKLAEQAGLKPEVVDIDLLEELKGAYTTDKIVRIPDAEVIDLEIEVRYKNTACGRILVDSRPRTSWRSTYATKLAAEMAAQRAEHAILATQHPPKNKGAICREDEILIVHPHHVVEIVGLLREALIRMHRTKLSDEKRAEKKLKLYDHITSTTFRRRLAEVGKLAEELGELAVEEKKEHDRMWKKRDLVATKIGTVNRGVIEEINDIVDGIEK